MVEPVHVGVEVALQVFGADRVIHAVNAVNECQDVLEQFALDGVVFSNKPILLGLEIEIRSFLFKKKTFQCCSVKRHLDDASSPRVLVYLFHPAH